MCILIPVPCRLAPETLAVLEFVTDAVLRETHLLGMNKQRLVRRLSARLAAAAGCYGLFGSSLSKPAAHMVGHMAWVHLVCPVGVALHMTFPHRAESQTLEKYTVAAAF